MTRPHKSPLRAREAPPSPPCEPLHAEEPSLPSSSSLPSPPDPNDPATYRHTSYTVNKDVEDIYARWDAAVPEETRAELEEFSLGLLQAAPSSERELVAAMITLRRRFKMTPRRSQLMQCLGLLEMQDRMPEPWASSPERVERVRKLLVKKVSRPFRFLSLPCCSRFLCLPRSASSSQSSLSYSTSSYPFPATARPSPSPPLPSPLRSSPLPSLCLADTTQRNAHRQPSPNLACS